MSKILRNGIRMIFDFSLKLNPLRSKCFQTQNSLHTQIFFLAILPSMDMPLGRFVIYGVTGIYILAKKLKLFPHTNLS